MHLHVNEMPSVGYNAVFASTSNRFSLREAIDHHARLEAACDDLIQKQDALIRAVARRCRAVLPEGAGPADHARPVLSGLTQSAKAEGSQFEDKRYDAFAPLASAKFTQKASESEAESIEAHEFEIAQLRAGMLLDALECSGFF